MTVATSRTFRSGNSVAVRLPKEMALPEGVEVTIVRSGDVLTISPKRGDPAEIVRRLERLPKPDYIEERDVEPLPERPGI